MDKSKLVPGEELGSDPPPYSSLFGSQSHEHAAIPSAPRQMPIPEDSTVYNSTNRVTMDNEIPVPKFCLNSPYPMTNVPLPPANQEWAHDQTEAGPSGSENDNGSDLKCRCLIIFLVVGIISAAIVVGVRMYQKHHGGEPEIPTSALDELDDENFGDSLQMAADDTNQKYLEDFERSYYHNDRFSGSQDDVRYKQMARDKDFEDFEDDDSFDFHEQPLFDKLFKSEKSYRKRRDLTPRNTSGSKKLNS